MTDIVLIVFLTAMTKYMTKDNSRKKVFILAQGLTVPSTIVKSPQQKRKAGGCIMSGARKQREINVVIWLAFFLWSFSAQGVAAPIFKVGLSCSVLVQLSGNEAFFFIYLLLLNHVNWTLSVQIRTQLI